MGVLCVGTRATYGWFCAGCRKSSDWQSFVAKLAMLYLCCISKTLVSVTVKGAASTNIKFCLNMFKSKKYRING